MMAGRAALEDLGMKKFAILAAASLALAACSSGGDADKDATPSVPGPDRSRHDRRVFTDARPIVQNTIRIVLGSHVESPSLNKNVNLCLYKIVISS